MSERFICEPLTSNEKNANDITDFVIDREADFREIKDEVIGLEAYLKRCAWKEDLRGEVKIYLIKDVEKECVAAYFGLKAGMVVNNEEGIPSEDESFIYISYHRRCCGKDRGSHDIPVCSG